MQITLTKQQLVLAVVVVIGLCVGMMLYSQPHNPGPSPDSSKPNLSAVFGSSSEGHRDAMLAAGFFDGFSSAIAYDGSRPDPQFKSGAALEQLRVDSLDFCFKGFSFTKYSSDDKTRDFASVVGGYLDNTVGTDGETLDRQKWVDAYRTLAAQARLAAQ